MPSGIDPPARTDMLRTKTRVETVMVLACAIALGGCEITSGDGSGSLAGAFSGSSATGRGGNGAAAVAVTNAALGGLIGGKLGGALNDEDRRLAYEAQL